MADQLAPNLLTIDPVTGGIGEDFSGHVHAAGLDLDAGSTGTPPDVDRVRWLRTGDGAAIAALYASSFGTTEALSLIASASPNTDTSTATLAAVTLSGSGSAKLTVNQSNDGALANVDASVGLITRRLVDQASRSHFLQIPSLAQRAVDIGQATAVFTASQTSAQIDIAHNLGRVPQVVVAMFNGFFGVLAENGGAPPDAAQIHLIGWSLAGVTTAAPGFWWIAIG